MLTGDTAANTKVGKIAGYRLDVYAGALQALLPGNFNLRIVVLGNLDDFVKTEALFLCQRGSSRQNGNTKEEPNTKKPLH
jgi:hypothetical protein